MIGSKFYQRKLTNGIVKLYALTNFTYLEGTWYPKNPEKSYIKIYPIIGIYKDFNLPEECFYHPGIHILAEIRKMPWCDTFEAFKELFTRHPNLFKTMHRNIDNADACTSDIIYTHFRFSTDECVVRMRHGDDYSYIDIHYIAIPSGVEWGTYNCLLPKDNGELMPIPEKVKGPNIRNYYDPDVTCMFPERFQPTFR